MAMDQETRNRRVAELNRRRERALYDIQQAEDARVSDNPWQQRIDLLTESLATVATDRAALDSLPPEPTADFPALTIHHVTVSTDEPTTVSLTIGEQVFRFVELIDWDNRGGMVVRGELQLQAGSVNGLLPNGVSQATQDAARQALTDALSVFAVAVRDSALDGEPIPVAETLPALASPDAEVGGWCDWHGTNAVRVERAYRRQQLRAEAARLERERSDEQEQQRALIDRLPIARKRLQMIDTELRDLGADQ